MPEAQHEGNRTCARHETRRVYLTGHAHPTRRVGPFHVKRRGSGRQDHDVTIRFDTLRLRDEASGGDLVVDNLALERGHGGQ